MSDKIKIGIIGGGRIGKVHAESIAYHIPDAEVKTVADIFMNDEMEAFFKAMGVENTVKDPQEIFNDKEIQAVLVCSATNTHAEMTQLAAKAGKHIFCEKPIDSDIARIVETLKVVEEAGVKLQVGFNRRFDHNFKAIRDAVKAGKVGEPHIIKVTSRDPEPPPAEYVKVSGGIFMDMAIHDFDMVRYLSGSEVEEVYVHGAVLVDPAIGEAGDIDTAVINLKFANGALGCIDISRKAAYGYDQRAEVFGSLGAVHSQNDSGSTAIISTAEGVTGEKPLFFFLERYMASFTAEVKDFITAIKTDGPVPVTGMDGLRPVQIAQAVGESLKTGLPVKVQY